MKTEIFKYTGFTDDKYTFEKEEGKIIYFAKCRKDLIEKFNLNSIDNINQLFSVSFFKTKPLNQISLQDEVFIISNMEPLK
jgi:hypothetical protein